MIIVAYAQKSCNTEFPVLITNPLRDCLIQLLDRHATLAMTVIALAMTYEPLLWI